MILSKYHFIYRAMNVIELLKSGLNAQTVKCRRNGEIFEVDGKAVFVKKDTGVKVGR